MQKEVIGERHDFMVGNIASITCTICPYEVDPRMGAWGCRELRSVFLPPLVKIYCTFLAGFEAVNVVSPNLFWWCIHNLKPKTWKIHLQRMVTEF